MEDLLHVFEFVLVLCKLALRALWDFINPASAWKEENPYAASPEDEE